MLHAAHGPGLTEAQIKDNLVLTGEKVGEPMMAAMLAAVAKAAFGVVPPDLSLVGRSRGADWLRTYTAQLLEGSRVEGW